MPHRSRIGVRCRTLRNVITAKGIVRRDTWGIIRKELTTLLGRHVVQVDWENGMRVPVPPHEIAVLKPGS